MLNISFIQQDIQWEDKPYNLARYENQWTTIPSNAHIIILPEMFSTGFSMNAKAIAETMEGTSIGWMKTQSRKLKKIITGSLVIEENGNYYNRMIWMMPNGQYYHYDKRHLFSYAGENEYYTAGNKRLIVQVNGWKICLQICYDLRFPVWARQQAEPYDMLINIASWPEKRVQAWNTLLKARAIENMCYVVGVNRIGKDANGIYHSGESGIYDPFGNTIVHIKDKEGTYHHSFMKNDLEKVREQFQFLNDADKFMIL